jgi:hypothetical protein
MCSNCPVGRWSSFLRIFRSEFGNLILRNLRPGQPVFSPRDKMHSQFHSGIGNNRTLNKDAQIPQLILQRGHIRSCLGDQGRTAKASTAGSRTGHAARDPVTNDIVSSRYFAEVFSYDERNRLVKEKTSVGRTLCYDSRNNQERSLMHSTTEPRGDGVRSVY